MVIDVLGDDGVEVCPLDPGDGAVFDLSEHGVVYSFIHLPGATVRVRGCRDRRTEILACDSMPVFEL